MNYLLPALAGAWIVSMAGVLLTSPPRHVSRRYPLMVRLGIGRARERVAAEHLAMMRRQWRWMRFSWGIAFMGIMLSTFG